MQRHEQKVPLLAHQPLAVRARQVRRAPVVYAVADTATDADTTSHGFDDRYGLAISRWIAHRYRIAIEGHEVSW